MKPLLAGLVLSLTGARAFAALGEARYVEFHAAAAAFPLVSGGKAAGLQVDAGHVI